MRRPPRAALRVVFLDYLAFYRTNWSEGKLCLCNEAAVKARARRFLGAAEPCPAEGCSPFSVPSLAEKCLRMHSGQGGLVFRKLLKAFGFLELLCVNLFLSPWRKEIRTLKTFTGNFVYCMQSVLPKCVVEELLEKIGYVATTATEFSLVGKLNAEDAEQAAFEIFLARIECEDLLEITKDVRDSDLGDVLQKRARKHWGLEGEVDRKYRHSHGKEHMLGRGGNKSSGDSYSPQIYWTNDRMASEKAGNTELERKPTHAGTIAEPQQVPSEFSSEPSSNPSQGNVLFSGVKSSDSEDFLTKYSDIVIGQKPLHLTSLPLKASEDKSQSTGLIGTMLGIPASASRSQTALSPNASGPQALAILNDVALEGREVSCYHGAKESSKETTESKIRDAMSGISIFGSHTMDQPKELKGESAVQHSNKLHIVMCLSKEGNHFACKQKVKEGREGELGYPVEETAQAEFATHNRPQEFNPSRLKLASVPGGDKEDFSIDLYSSDQFPNATRNVYPSGLKFDGLSVSVSSPHQETGCYRYTGDPPGSTRTVLPSSSEVQFPTSNPDLQGREDLEGHSLPPSFTDEISIPTCIVKINETNPEGFVLISKD